MVPVDEIAHDPRTHVAVALPLKRGGDVGAHAVWSRHRREPQFPQAAVGRGRHKPVVMVIGQRLEPEGSPFERRRSHVDHAQQATRKLGAPVEPSRAWHAPGVRRAQDQKLSQKQRERAAASEPRDRSAPTKRRARARVGESEGRSPSEKISGGARTPRARAPARLPISTPDSAGHPRPVDATRGRPGHGRLGAGRRS